MMKADSEKCIICERDVETGSKLSFCRLHLEAYQNIVKGYVNWSGAYGDLAPEEFLRRLENNDYSGKWVKEVAHIITSRHDLLQFFLNDLSYWGKKS